LNKKKRAKRCYTLAPQKRTLMKRQYRTTLDGVNYILVKPSQPQPQPKPKESPPRNVAERFNFIRAVIDDARLLEPQDLTE